MPVVDDTRMLRHDGQPVARLVVTDIYFPWVRGRAETLPGYESVRALCVGTVVAAEQDLLRRSGTLPGLASVGSAAAVDVLDRYLATYLPRGDLLQSAVGDGGVDPCRS